MASSNSFKSLQKEYNELKNWAASIVSTSPIFRVDTSSDEESGEPPSCESASAENKPAQHLSIFGWIFPSTEPFQKRGLRIEIQVPTTYRREPPKVYMRVPIRHPNIEKDGEICSTLLDSAKKWESMSLPNVMKTIVKLLDEPEMGYVMDAESGSLLRTNPATYNRNISEVAIRHGVLRA